MLRGVGFLTAVGVRAFVAVLGIEAVVHEAVEFISAVEPWTSAHEDAAGKPFRAVVAEWGASVRRGIIVAIWAVGRSRSFARLRACHRRFCRQENARNNRENYKNNEPLQVSFSAP